MYSDKDIGLDTYVKKLIIILYISIDKPNSTGEEDDSDSESERNSEIENDSDSEETTDFDADNLLFQSASEHWAEQLDATLVVTVHCN